MFYYGVLFLAILAVSPTAGKQLPATAHDNVPDRLSLQVNNIKGQEVFGQRCQGCHNISSNERKIGPGLKGIFKVKSHIRPDGSIHIHDDRTLRRQIENGGGGMPGMKGILSREDIENVIGYLHTL